MPPLLQHLMGQPPVSVQDIERDSFPRPLTSISTNPGYTDATLTSSNSVPKIASPPKTVSAVWSSSQATVVGAAAELESPNTVLRRTLNLDVTKSDVMPVLSSSDHVSSSVSRTLLPTITTAQTSNLMRGVTPEHLAQPITTSDQLQHDDVTNRMRDLNVDSSTSASGVSAKRGASLRLDMVGRDVTSECGGDDVSEPPQLMTPQAILEKASLSMLGRSALVQNTVRTYQKISFNDSTCLHSIVSVQVFSIITCPASSKLCNVTLVCRMLRAIRHRVEFFSRRTPSCQVHLRHNFLVIHPPCRQCPVHLDHSQHQLPLITV